MVLEQNVVPIGDWWRLPEILHEAFMNQLGGNHSGDRHVVGFAERLALIDFGD